MEVKFNKKSWHSNVYAALYGNNLPDNLCAYFWKTLFAIVTLPAWCIASKSANCSPPAEKVLMGGALNTIMFVLVFSFASVSVEKLTTTAPIWLYFLMPYLTIIGIILTVSLLFLLIYCCMIVYEKFESRRNSKDTKTDGFFTSKIRATKNKYCPKIIWKDTNNE